MNYIFIDFEFTSVGKMKENLKINQEIISIGGVKCTKKGIVIDTFYTLVRPTECEFLSDFCVNITKISQKDLKSVNTVEVEILNFYNWINDGESYKIFTWGRWDRYVLFNEMKRKNINLHFLFRNIQNDISLFISNGSNKELSLQKAKSYFNLSGGVSHNSLQDAIDLKDVFYKFLKCKKERKYD